MAARAAAENAMASPSFDRFLAQYRREKGDTLAVPLMQVGHLQNKTDDAAPDCSPLRRHTARHTHRKAVLQVRRTAFL